MQDDEGPSQDIITVSENVEVDTTKHPSGIIPTLQYVILVP